VIPLIQNYAWLSLEPMHIHVSLPSRTAGSDLGVRIPESFSVAIGTTPELIQNAAVRFLGLSSDEIAQHAQDVIEHAILSELAKLTDSIEAGQTEPDRKAFQAEMESALATGLEPLGLVLTSSRRE